MHTLSEQGIALIARWEGFSPLAYICPAGFNTIGYGHVIGAGELFPGGGITRMQARELLRADAQVAARAVARLIGVPLSQGQLDALISFTFNLGAGALQRSTLRRKVNRAEHDAVPAELMKWVWGGGRKLPGLVKRRADEARVYGGG